MLAHEKEIAEYQTTLQALKDRNEANALWSKEEIAQFEKKLEELKNTIYSRLTPWDRVAICRHPQRPKALDYIRVVCEDFTEISGDRLFADDLAIITGFAKIGGQKCVVIAQEKGNDTASRLQRNFGMPHPEGYRKALRAMQLADKFQLPIVSLVDTPGAYPGLAAEERGQGRAIACNIFEMFRLQVPIIVLIIGEGCSGGAIGMGVGDEVCMLEHSYYSVISPEGCASILWKDVKKNAEAAATLKIHAEELQAFGVIDSILPEPIGGAHQDPAAMYVVVKQFLQDKLKTLQTIEIKDLVEARYQKFRVLGRFETETIL